MFLSWQSQRKPGAHELFQSALQLPSQSKMALTKDA